MSDLSSSTLDAEDYYFDGPFLVFTAAYHLKRGVCCGNSCRHCPYDQDGNAVAGRGEASATDRATQPGTD